mmetsp:Transcript_3642/g.9225  ORF Transcript_3642/g.9225 Transcript_3642/m.9225 type:complete len:399 (+) Transcript_3642:66-1262(+)
MAAKAPQQPALPWTPSLRTEAQCDCAGTDPSSASRGNVAKPRRVWRSTAAHGSITEPPPSTGKVREEVQQVKTLKKRTTSEKIDAKGLAVSQKVQHWRKEMPAGSAGSAQAAARDPPQPPDVHEKGQDQRQQHQDGLKTAHSCRSLEQPLIEAKDAEEEKGVKQVLPGGVEEETQELQSETCAQGFDSPSSAQEDGMQATELTLESASVAGDDQAMFMNTCCLCGETHVLIADLGHDFTCEFIDIRCMADEASASCGRGDAAQVAPHQEGTSGTDQHIDLRTRCLLQAAHEKLSRFELAELLLAKGLDPAVSEDEVVSAIARSKDRAQQLAWERSRAKMGPATRYLDGQVVQLKNGTRFLQEDKESKEQRAMTSVSIRVLGSHTGTSSIKEKKKGPRS